MLWNFWKNFVRKSSGDETVEERENADDSRATTETPGERNIDRILVKTKNKMSAPRVTPQTEKDKIYGKCSSHSQIYWFICSSFLCMFILSSLLITYVNKKTHVSVIENINKNTNNNNHYNNEHIKSEFAKNEIEMLVRNYIKDNYGFLKYKDNDISKEMPYTPEHHEHQRFERKAMHLVNKRETGEEEIEFFNPKYRAELEARDAEIIKKTGQKGAAPGGDSWVWMTAQSRVPHGVITTFCKATQDYCPPGKTGFPGIPGPQGNRGDMGIPGPPGLDGLVGKPGPIGPRGEKGSAGDSGLDGRDGVPGEPGLDGVPGRAGADGIPGKDGKDGVNGLHGRNGQDGKDGLAGPQGPMGAMGPQGEKGTSGPRGRSGRPGTNGIPGIPGIIAHEVRVNGTVSNELLIPPSIAKTDSGDIKKAYVAREGDHLRLRCAATGFPRPHVEWHREDGKTISMGIWQASSIPGHTLNITSINRVHMGAYQCVADNGIPPPANQTFYIEVHFPPLIKVKSLHNYAPIGSNAIMECEVESFPEAVPYWERKSDGRLLEFGDKYQMNTTTSGYKSTVVLNIANVRPHDYGEYYCISKNELGITRATILLQDRRQFITPLPDHTDYILYGNRPPDKVSLEDLCGPPTTCPDCSEPRDLKCKDTIVSLYDLVGNLEIKPTENISYPGLHNRTLDCVLYAVGKPVYNKFTDEAYGAWLKDSMPRNDMVGEKIWATRENDSLHLFEYTNRSDYRSDIQKKVFTLPKAFRGNTHVIYNGSFYYNARDEPQIIKFDLGSEKITLNKKIPGLTNNGSNYLYTTEYNYIDFNVDDNGLWIIYGTSDSNHTIIAKLDAYTLEIQYSWNISVNHHKVGEMFIVCGVLYAIDSVTDRNTKIRLALDLYQSKLLDVSLTFTNPFRKTTTVGYNPRNKELYTWDKGNQLTYPIRYHEIGYNTTSSEKMDDNLNPQMQTGVEIFQDNGLENN